MIEVQNLDVEMYIKMCSLFNGSKSICWSYVHEVMNYVSHIPMENLQGSASEEVFKTDFTILKDNLHDSRVYWLQLEDFEQSIINNSAVRKFKFILLMRIDIG